MKRYIFIITIAMAVVTNWTAPGDCHGVTGSIDPAPGYRISAMYDDGEPMSYAKVEITAPDADPPFQVGRTDRNGAMMFQPDGPGNWQVVIADGMGHRKSFEIAVSEGFGDGVKNSNTLTAYERTDRLISNRTLSIVAGLSIIFGLFGTIYGRHWQKLVKHHNTGKYSAH